MIHESESTLDLFRTPGRCAWCGKSCRLREPAHIFACGMGSGKRLDIRVNLVALGSTLAYECSCHTKHHNGQKPTHADLLEIAARREQTTPEDIVRVVYLLLYLPKQPAARDIREAEERFSFTVSETALLWKTLGEAGIQEAA